MIQGGLKVNMVAADCSFEVDIRLPNGIDQTPILREVDRIVAGNPEVSYETILYNPPSWCPPDAEMAGYVRANAISVGNIDPVPVISLGGTDARLWRYADIPAIVYGPAPSGMGSFDEHVTLDDFLHVVRCHVLSAYDYLSVPASS
jgi:succinyl-diaminopimelate desuccinylase